MINSRRYRQNQKMISQLRMQLQRLQVNTTPTLEQLEAERKRITKEIEIGRLKEKYNKEILFSSVYFFLFITSLVLVIGYRLYAFSGLLTWVVIMLIMRFYKACKAKKEITNYKLTEFAEAL